MTSRKGYAVTWEDYWAAGWTPTPLERGTKFPPERDVTGNTPSRYDPTTRDFKRWAAENPRGNLMIVVPETVMGLDVDAYHGGLTTLARLEREQGKLPTSWKSTSRDDGSGIHLYRVPRGTRLVGNIKSGIEIVQHHHRYCVCWPSIHPSGQMYRWYVGSTVVDIPRVTELPDLPRAWLKALTDRPKAAGDGTPYSGDVDTWLAAHDADHAPASACRIIRTAEQRFANECRHDVMVELTGALVALGAQGKPVAPAIEELEVLFCDAVGSDREGTEEYEYWSAVEGAVKRWGGAKQRLPLGSVTFGGRS